MYLQVQQIVVLPLTTADFNDDGKLNMAEVAYPQGSVVTTIFIFLENGDGTLKSSIQPASPVNSVSYIADHRHAVAGCVFSQLRRMGEAACASG